jgi:dTDP-4-dehydrorhamnose reductase
MSSLAWVTGAGGLIGSHIIASAARFAPNWTIHALTRDRLDLGDSVQVARTFEAAPPDLVIHCAAVSQSPICQSNPALAWDTNVRVTEQLADLTSDRRLLFFSSDLVFDGAQGAYRESAPVHPLSIYAETKVAAEQIVLRNGRHIVIRTSLNAGPSPTRDRAFDELLRIAWERGEAPRLFTDEFRSPIAASVTARVIWEIVTQELTGLFHVAGAQRLSRFEIGQLLAGHFTHLKPRIEPTSLQIYSGPPRAPDTSLDCGKIQAHLSFPLPGFADWWHANAPDAVRFTA